MNIPLFYRIIFCSFTVPFQDCCYHTDSLTLPCISTDLSTHLIYFIPKANTAPPIYTNYKHHKEMVNFNNKEQQ